MAIFKQLEGFLWGKELWFFGLVTEDLQGSVIWT